MKSRLVFAGLVLAMVAPSLAFAGSARTEAQKGVLGEVQFAFDSSRLGPETKAELKSVVSYASSHPDARIVLDAHCDPIGTSPYNIGLAIRRAESVKAELVHMGVPNEQLVLAIYGEEGADRASYALDRRVTVWPTRASLTAVIDTTLAAKGTSVTWGRPLTTAQIDAVPEPVAYR
jgi:outer membrane protein OmpA-like peptidoglycan-associated protein